MDTHKLTPALRRLTDFDLRNIQGRMRYTPDVLENLCRIYRLHPAELELAIWPQIVSVDKLYKLLHHLGGTLTTDDELVIFGEIERRNAAASKKVKAR